LKREEMEDLIKKKEEINEIPLSAGTEVHATGASIPVAAPAEGSVSETSRLESPSAKQPLSFDLDHTKVS
jgi:hypothetical protein